MVECSRVSSQYQMYACWLRLFLGFFGVQCFNFCYCRPRERKRSRSVSLTESVYSSTVAEPSGTEKLIDEEVAEQGAVSTLVSVC